MVKWFDKCILKCTPFMSIFKQLVFSSRVWGIRVPLKNTLDVSTGFPDSVVCWFCEQHVLNTPRSMRDFRGSGSFKNLETVLTCWPSFISILCGEIPFAFYLISLDCSVSVTSRARPNAIFQRENYYRWPPQKHINTHEKSEPADQNYKITEMLLQCCGNNNFLKIKFELRQIYKRLKCHVELLTLFAL